MNDHSPTPEEIGANAERIARVLGRRLSPKRLSGSARDAVMWAFFNFRKTGSLSAFDTELDAAAAIVPPPRRAYAVCRLLLEAAWAVPPGSPLVDRLARRLHAQFLRCRADDEDLFDALRKEFVLCQRSSLPVVRRLVGDALIDEPPDASELTLLTDDRQPHDIRSQIAGRILLADRAVDFGVLFNYYVQVARQADRRRPGDPATPAVEKLTDMLKSCIGRDAKWDIFKELYPKFVSHHREPGVAGGFMKLLREYGTPLVNQLEAQFRTPTPGERAAIALLLGHMAQHGGSVRAVEVMTDLLIEARGEGAKELTAAFVNAAKGTSAFDPTAESDRVRRAFLEALSRFEQTPDPVLRVVAAELRRLENEGVQPEELANYLRGRVDKATESRLRYLGPDRFQELIAACRDPDRPAAERLRAVDMLGRILNPRLRDQVPEHAWQVYVTDADVSVRAAALRVVASRGRALSEADRQRLAVDSETATGQLRAAFDDYGEILFPPEKLTERPKERPAPGANAS